MKHNYLLGTDPEVFVWSIGENKGVSAHDIIPGTKDKPYATKHGFIHPDGLAAEFNISPVKTPDEFATAVLSTLQDLRDVVNDRMEDTLLLSSPTITFKKDYLESLPADVQALGCMPDYNAWTLELNEAPDGNVEFRSGGFHLHVGYTEGESISSDSHFADCAERVRQLECAIFPVSLLWDNDTFRRRLYGQMGSFRPKSYGFEWRTLSNSILKHKEDGLTWLAKTALHAMEDYDNDVLYIENETVRETLARVAGGEVTKDELREYSGNFLHNEFGIPTPYFV